MKKLFIINLLVFLFSAQYAQSKIYDIKPYVDERTELLGVIFHLAGAKEFNNYRIEKYANEIDEYFNDYKNHKVIKYSKRLRIKQGISYNAVMSMALNIEINDGKINFKEGLTEDSMEDRWKGKDYKFLSLLNAFYNSSNFHQFYMNHTELYLATGKSFEKHLNKVDFSWFNSFFGESPNGEFKVIMSLTNWGNYGINIKYLNGKENIYAIMGAWQTDSSGIPAYNDNVINTIIHEFNHSFCNQLITENYASFEDKAEYLYSLVKQKMIKQAYGKPKTLMYEILVRASVIKYYQSHLTDDFISEEEINIRLGIERSKGFIWISELVDKLSEYEEGNYKTLKEFMPEIVNLSNSLDIDNLFEEYENNCPKIVSTNIKNGDKNVDPNLKQLIISFDRPMIDGKEGLAFGKHGKERFPEVVDAKWNEMTDQWFINIKLEPNKKYSINIPSVWFYGKESYNNLLQSYSLDFKTAKL